MRRWRAVGALDRDTGEKGGTEVPVFT